MADAVIVSTARTGIGRAYRGAFNNTHGATLAGHVIKAAVERARVEPGEVEDVIIGCALPEGATGQNIARQAALRAGLPVSTGGVTVNRFCSSGMQAIAMAAQRVIVDRVPVMVAGGVESISLVQNEHFNNHRIHEPWIDEHKPEVYMPMIDTAEVVAKRYYITREQQDEYALASQQRTAAGQKSGRFDKEIVPIELDVPVDNGGGTATLTRTRFAVDEAIRETTLEKMAALQPSFIPDGVVTAGNSSQIVDGSAAVLIASEEKAAQLGLQPRARFVSFGIAGVDPHLMLHGNPQACERALAKASLTWDDIEVIEVNEAFASVVLQFLADTGLRERYEAGDVNPNGGGISLGHPLGATGARITATLVSELERRNARYGIGAMCIGFGQAIAGVVERL